MFKELVPILRSRAVLMTATALDDDQIRVNVVPKKVKDGDHDALTTPLSVTGTAEELDRELPAAVVGFVGAHLQLKNTLDRAKEEIEEAAKAARAEARTKAKTPVKSEPAKPTAPAAAPKPGQPVNPEPAGPKGLFDAPGQASSDETEEDAELPEETAEEEDESGSLDEAA